MMSWVNSLIAPGTVVDTFMERCHKSFSDGRIKEMILKGGRH